MYSVGIDHTLAKALGNAARLNIANMWEQIQVKVKK